VGSEGQALGRGPGGLRRQSGWGREGRGHPQGRGGADDRVDGCVGSVYQQIKNHLRFICRGFYSICLQKRMINALNR